MQVVSAFLSFLVFSMSGSSNDHVLRDGARPDEMDDIFSTLSHRQLNVLYGVLTNNSCRMVFMDRLQDFVVARADNIVRGGPPQNAMPKAMPKIIAKEYNPLSPRGPPTFSRPYRPPRRSIGWRPDVATFVTPPPPPTPSPKSPPSSEHPRPSGLNSVKAFCAKAVGDAVPNVTHQLNSRSRSRSRSRHRLIEHVD